MKYRIYLTIFSVLLIVGCQSVFVDFGAGYSRFNFDTIRSSTVINSKTVETKLNHTDTFMTKIRTGGSFVEALPQMRASVEVRGAFGGGVDTERVDNRKAYSEMIMIMFGGGPCLSWQQALGKHLFLEAGTFISAYTVGVHERGYLKYGYIYDSERDGGTGWSGGAYAKLGVNDTPDIPMKFAMELSYELGQWDFGGTIGHVDMEGIGVLISSEIKF